MFTPISQIENLAQFKKEIFNGKIYVFEKSKISPDICPIAKGIGGGFPIGAVLMTNKVAKAMQPGSHGSTFGGNPLAMKVGSKVMDIISKKSFLKKY